MPSIEEIKNVVFSLNKDDLPSLGFGGFFLRNYWIIIKNNVCNVLYEFFTTSKFIFHFNAKNVIPVHESTNAYTLFYSRPIAMANLFKVISKIMANGLAIILTDILSNE